MTVRGGRVKSSGKETQGEKVGVKIEGKRCRSYYIISCFQLKMKQEGNMRKKNRAQRG